MGDGGGRSGARRQAAAGGEGAGTRRALPPRRAAASPAGKRRLGYLEQRELDGIEPRILAAEERLETPKAECHRPEVVSDGPRLVALAREIEEAQAEVDRLYARWAELSS